MSTSGLVVLWESRGKVEAWVMVVDTVERVAQIDIVEVEKTLRTACGIK